MILRLFLICGFILTNHASYKTLSSKRTASQYEKHDYTFYEKNVRENRKDTLNAKQMTTEWIKKAKSENNFEQQCKAYKAMMHLVKKDFRMIYADSLLLTAKESKEDELIGAAYLSIGVAYYENRDLVNALNHYVEANNYLIKTNNEYQAHKVKFSIAQTKYYLGFYQEAIALLNDCKTYYKEDNQMAYVKTLHALVLCFIKIKRFDQAVHHHNLGQNISLSLDFVDMLPFFQHTEGIILYEQNKTEKAIVLLNQSLSAHEANKDHMNTVSAWFYLGKAYWKQGNKQEAMNYFLKVADSKEDNVLLKPELRENYEFLIKYYKENGENELQLKTIESLLTYDKAINEEYKFLSQQIHKEFDTKTLQNKKALLIQEMNHQKILMRFWIFVFLAVLLLIMGLYHRAKKRQRIKFESIMNEWKHKKTADKEVVMGEVETKEPSKSNQTKQSKVNISDELMDSILEKLEKFEKKHKFLEKDMSASRMAELLHTNTKYVSLTIQMHRGKSIIHYINDLRIDYVVNLLIHQNKFRNYTNKALAEEVGFGSTQIFTNCFKKKMNMSPTNFISELKKDTATSDKMNV